MAEEATAAPPVEAPAPAAVTEVEEPTQTNGDVATVPEDAEPAADVQDTTEVTAPEGDTTEVTEAPAATADEAEASQLASGSKKEKRKSSGTVPEHKNKKLNKKKSMPNLHLECKPGEYYWAKLKGYPNWPSVVCDEQMLPESLLATRPVSTARPDGSIRDDFKEGGKNAKERTFPIMFLATNEFMWMINTSLEPLDLEQVQDLPKTKMTKALQNAWKIAAEKHDLEYFKGILKTWQEEEAQIEKEMREEDERQRKLAEEKALRDKEDAEKAAAEEATGKKKKSRKSKGGDEDVDMEDADAPKSAKKRKKDAESDAEGAKPKKTPKVTKLNAPKTPNGDSSAKKSATKSKKKVVQAPKEDEEEEKPQMSEAERMQTRDKAVLYLRHRLQKGFLSRDQAPQEAEMAGMAEFFAQLEAYHDLEPVIIRNTKVHKVLKAIVKLSSIPKDEEYNFKKRSAAMLEVWNKRMESDGDAPPPSATESKPPVSVAAPAEEEEKQEAAVQVATNGENAVTEEPTKEEDEATEGAQVEKVEEAADKLDEKVEATVDESTEETKEVAPTAIEPAAEAPKSDGVELKDITMGEADAGEEQAKEPHATVTEIPTAPEVD